MDRGIYVAIFFLGKAQTIQVGRLGRFHCPRGWYFYMGSAQKNLTARLRRHGQRQKPKRWHIDYLSVRATMLGAIVVAGGADLECRLARILATRYDRPIKGFGASDCRCDGHLFYRCGPLNAWYTAGLAMCELRGARALGPA